MAQFMLRSYGEVDDMARKLVDPSHEPSRVQGMTYEQGMRDALEWVLLNAKTQETFEGLLD